MPTLPKLAASVHLLGSPHFGGDAHGRALDGRKPWALLAYLVLESQPPTRRQVAALLSPEADDPLAAVRWTLLQLRRAIDGFGQVSDDGRMHLSWSPGVSVDVESLLAGEVAPRDVTEVVAGNLLDGLDVGTSEFELWLTLQRSRVASAAADALRSAATALAREDPVAALAVLQRAVELSPFDDALHELVVDVQVQKGDSAGAAAYAAQVERRYRDELGTAPPQSLRRPLDRDAPVAGAPLLSLDMAARHLLEMAEGRFSAGDYDGALSTARRAAERASASGDTAVEARALTVLASLLIHSVRGRDAEAVGLLHHALQLAQRLGDAEVISDIERETGYVALLQAQYGAAEAALQRAQAAAGRVGDTERQQRAAVYQALCRSDRCDYSSAEQVLREVLDALAAGGDRPALASYAGATLARVLVLTDRLDEAVAVADEAVAIAHDTGAMSLLPWAMVWSAEAWRRKGDGQRARQQFAESFTLGCEVADPCWESLALRGIAAVERDSGHADEARDLLRDAMQRVRRYPDVYQWAHTAVLTDLVELEGGGDVDNVASAVALARSGPMPDFMARLAGFAS